MQRTRLTLILLVLGFAAATAAADEPKAGQPPQTTDKAGLGKHIGEFTLPAVSGDAVSLSQFAKKHAVVLVFLGTECPINNLYVRRLADLHEQFKSKGVQFLGINSNSQDSFARVAAHAKKFAIPFPVLKDERNILADRCGARRTPEAILLDGKRIIRYQGRIDDQFGFDYQRKQATREDLAEALHEVLAGKQVSRPFTEVPGCHIGRVVEPRKDGPITFTREIVPILQNHCQECHRKGQIGPMSLFDYDDVVSWSAMIKEVVEEKRMPPWYADPRYGKFMNDRTLPKKDRDTLLAWIKQGMPRGNISDAPTPRRFATTWTIGKPDVVISMPEAFEVPVDMPRGGVPYKYFVVPTDFAEDKWIERAEARPGAAEVVHHILVFILPPGKTFRPGSKATPVLCGMAPGEQPLILPPGLAKELPKGSRLLFQLHYTPNGKPYTDRSSIGLTFAKKPPKMKVVTQPVYNMFFRIPPGAAHHEVRSSYTFREDGYVMGYMPHMHLRGKDFRYQAIYPADQNGTRKEETLLLVSNFNFNWQGAYRPHTPIKMPKGTKIECIAHFDNSNDNPNNPDPTQAVFWGDQTWQEMMIGWIDFAYPLDQNTKN